MASVFTRLHLPVMAQQIAARQQSNNSDHTPHITLYTFSYLEPATIFK